MLDNIPEIMSQYHLVEFFNIDTTFFNGPFGSCNGHVGCIDIFTGITSFRDAGYFLELIYDLPRLTIYAFIIVSIEIICRKFLVSLYHFRYITTGSAYNGLYHHTFFFSEVSLGGLRIKVQPKPTNKCLKRIIFLIV